MTTEKLVVRTGIGFSDAVGLLFVALKLTGFIAWSWWFVTAPLWGPVLLILVLVQISNLLTRLLD